MIDRFKFRVLDEVSNKYVNNGVLLRCGELAIPTMKNDYDINPVDGCYIIEQCTGLKDKNGKLIYEGDIVQLTRERRWLPKGSLHIIEWRTFNCCGFCLGCLGSLTEKCSKECIVIGNIHENVELLKEKALKEMEGVK